MRIYKDTRFLGCTFLLYECNSFLVAVFELLFALGDKTRDKSKNVKLNGLGLIIYSRLHGTNDIQSVLSI